MYLFSNNKPACGSEDSDRSGNFKIPIASRYIYWPYHASLASVPSSGIGGRIKFEWMLIENNPDLGMVMVLLYSSDVPALQSRFLGDVSGLAEYVDNTVRIILINT